MAFPDTTGRPARHAVAAAALLGAAVLWLLYYVVRPSCPASYVHFDLGIPAAVAALCGGVGGWQLVRVRFPSRQGVVAAALTIVSAVPVLGGVALLVATCCGWVDDCWTF